MPLPLDEDPYSVLNSYDGVSQKMADTLRETKPPKLPPRDLNRVPVPTVSFRKIILTKWSQYREYSSIKLITIIKLSCWVTVYSDPSTINLGKRQL